MSLEMAPKVIVPQKTIMSRSFLNSGTLIVIFICVPIPCPPIKFAYTYRYWAKNFLIKSLGWMLWGELIPRSISPYQKTHWDFHPPKSSFPIPFRFPTVEIIG
jgi:hypothetical protein